MGEGLSVENMEAPVLADVIKQGECNQLKMQEILKKLPRKQMVNMLMRSMAAEDDLEKTGMAEIREGLRHMNRRALTNMIMESVAFAVEDVTESARPEAGNA